MAKKLTKRQKAIRARNREEEIIREEKKLKDLPDKITAGVAPVPASEETKFLHPTYISDERRTQHTVKDLVESVNLIKKLKKKRKDAKKKNALASK